MNYPLGSSDSLATLSSHNSFNELNEVDDNVPMMIFNAVQELTLNSYDSSATLASQRASSEAQQVSLLMFFLRALEDFNTLVPDEVNTSDEDKQVLKKFC